MVILWYVPLCHRRLDVVEVQGSIVVRKQQGYDVEPNPEYEGYYKSQGYDDVGELYHVVGREVVDFEGHIRVVRSHASSSLKEIRGVPNALGSRGESPLRESVSS